MECIICYEVFTGSSDRTESSVAALPCGHFFHSICILRWLEQSSHCPICREKRKTFKMLHLYGNWPISNNNPTTTSKSSCIQITEQSKEIFEEKINTMKERIRRLTDEMAELKETYKSQITQMNQDMKTDKNILSELRNQLHHYEGRNKALKTRLSAVETALEEKSKQVETFHRIACVKNILEKQPDQNDEILLNTYIKTDGTNQDIMMKTLLIELNGSRRQLADTLKLLDAEKKNHDATRVRERVAISQLCAEQAKIRKMSTKISELRKEEMETHVPTQVNNNNTTEHSQPVDMHDVIYASTNKTNKSQSYSTNSKVNIPPTSRLITNNLHNKRIIGGRNIAKARPPGHYTFDGMGGSTRKPTSSPLGQVNSYKTQLFGSQRSQLFNSKR